MQYQQEKTSSDEHKIIGLNQWKKNNAQEAEKKSITKYLQILDLENLINESKLLMSEIKEGPLTKDLEIRSLMVLKEIQQRFSTDATLHATTLLRSFQDTEKKINQ